jgi:hypothetical protein
MIKRALFWDMTPCRNEESTAFLAICFHNVFLCSSETAVDFQLTIWCDIPGNGNLHNYQYENYTTTQQPLLGNGSANRQT